MLGPILLTEMPLADSLMTGRGGCARRDARVARIAAPLLLAPVGRAPKADNVLRRCRVLAPRLWLTAAPWVASQFAPGTHAQSLPGQLPVSRFMFCALQKPILVSCLASGQAVITGSFKRIDTGEMSLVTRRCGCARRGARVSAWLLRSFSLLLVAFQRQILVYEGVQSWLLALWPTAAPRVVSQITPGTHAQSLPGQLPVARFMFCALLTPIL